MDWFDGGWDERLARTRAAAAGIEEAGSCLAPLGTLQWESPAGRAFRVQLELLTAQVRYLSGIVEAAEAAVARAEAVAVAAVETRRAAGEIMQQGLRLAAEAGVEMMGSMVTAGTQGDFQYPAGTVRGGPDPVPRRPPGP